MELNKTYYMWLEKQEDGEYVIPMADPLSNISLNDLININ